MAKSPTRKKSKTKTVITPEHVAEAQQQVEQAIKYINDWKRQELFNMVKARPSRETPICIPINQNTYLIGQAGLKKTGSRWTIIEGPEGAEHSFTKRSTAIIYTLCKQTGRQKLADKILQHETKVTKVTEDVETFRFRKDSAIRKRDYWRVDYFDIMENCAAYKLESAKNQLEKSLQLAKYFKIW